MNYVHLFKYSQRNKREINNLENYFSWFGDLGIWEFGDWAADNNIISFSEFCQWAAFVAEVPLDFRKMP